MIHSVIATSPDRIRDRRLNARHDSRRIGRTPLRPTYQRSSRGNRALRRFRRLSAEIISTLPPSSASSIKAFCRSTAFKLLSTVSRVVGVPRIFFALLRSPLSISNVVFIYINSSTKLCMHLHRAGWPNGIVLWLWLPVRQERSLPIMPRWNSPSEFRFAVLRAAIRDFCDCGHV